MSYVSCLEARDVVIAFNDDKKEDGTNPGQEGAAKALERLNEVMDAGVARIVKPSRNDFGEMSRDEILEWKRKLI